MTSLALRALSDGSLSNAGDPPFNVGAVSISYVVSSGSIPSNMGSRSNAADRIKLVRLAVNRVVKVL